MSRRDNHRARCEVCHMHHTLCVCALQPALSPRTRLSLLIHYREARKPTNSGQLAARCLQGSSVNIVGDRQQPLTLPLVHEHEQGILLFPAEDAVAIETFASSPQPLVLIVPDGNWRQAGKMRNRVPGVAKLPCVVLPERAATTYRLRAEPRAGGLGTMEAIAYALGLLEGDAGPAMQAALLNVFRVMVERTLWLRGGLADHQVAGGIPAAALAANPRGGV